MDDEAEDLIAITPEAAAWVATQKAERSRDDVFGRIVSGVLWISGTQPDAETVGSDPSAFVAEINEKGMPSFRNHDPGLPIGRTVAARAFSSPRDVRFVAGIIGLYQKGQQHRFRDLGVDPTPPATSPGKLDALSNEHWLGVAVDPREVEGPWLDELLRDAPLRTERGELSHNAEEPLHELIRVVVSYWVLVWNPLTTIVANEAGKDLYRAVQRWLHKLWDKASELRNPVVSLSASQAGCEVSFLFRGKEVKRLYAAHEGLPLAAAQAAQLIRATNASGETAASLVYEFDPESARWFPSYLTLKSGRLVSDRAILIAIEQLPTGISLGLLREKT